MRIEGLKLKNIGVFKDVKMEFPKCPDGQAEIHIFTGVNGSGKSTILKALACGFQYDINSPYSIDENNLYSYFSLKRGHYPNCKIVLNSNKQINIVGEYLNNGEMAASISTDSQEVKFYKNELAHNASKLMPVSFAIFAYSGYRNIEDGKGLMAININPLYQALKFIKDPNPNHSLDEWVKKSLYKRAFARDNNLDKKETVYNDTIDKLENAISEIVGFNIRFSLDDTLENPVVKYHNQILSFDVLPDGLKSLVSWLADLCIRLDKIKWKDDIPVFNRNLILFLDEIENHLHIKWQRRVLPIVQKLLPNAQIFVTTHSPFVVNSIDDAWVHRLQLDEATKTATIAPPQSTSTGNSYITELMKTFEVYEEYGIPVSEKLQQFHKMKNHILEGKNGNTKEFLTLAKDLANVSPSLNNDIQIQLRKLSRQTSKEFSIHD